VRNSLVRATAAVRTRSFRRPSDAARRPGRH
jgi:hypothetical protein